MRKKRNPQCSMELHYVPHEICSQLYAISQWLDAHPQVNDWIYEDLSSGDKQNTGRNGLSAESVLRAEFTYRLITEEESASVFDVERELYDASTKIRVYSSLCTTPDESLFAFSSTLTTITLNNSRLRWFEACFRQPTSAGLPPSFLQLPHIRRIIL